MTRTKPQLIAQLNDRWRVCEDSNQWIIQVRKGRARPRATGYVGRRFCAQRTTLLRDIGQLCGEVDPQALVVIEALPEHHPGPKKWCSPEPLMVAA